MTSPALPAGTVFANRFEVSALIGSGGMGMVYRAIDQNSGSLVALKLLNAAGSPSESARFLREGRLLAELAHPGIVGYVAHGQDPNGALFLAMEWLQGEDLAARLSRGPLKISEILSLLMALASALAVPHERSILHRDLKPSNIFLRNGNAHEPVLLDFGIARRRSASLAVTGTGGVLGTPEYMSPEQARGEQDLSPATDIFSLGCVFYECLTGQPPFRGEHVAAVLVKILFEEPQSVAELRSGVPAELVELLLKMLVKDRSLRIADARALVHALDQVQLSHADAALSSIELHAAPVRFAEDEQSLVSMVVASPPAADAAESFEPGDGLMSEKERQQRALLQELRGLGAGVERLLNRTLVVSIRDIDDASDQAARAARMALLIKRRWPEAVVVLTTGRARSRDQTPVGEVAERAASLLREISDIGPASGSAHSVPRYSQSGVWLDRTSAGLLERQFVITEERGKTLLTGEELDVDQTRPLLGKPTACVGRDGELGTLEVMLSTCINNEEAAVALVTAQAGAGKSRLRHEFMRRLSARGQDGTALLGHASAVGAGQPYFLLRDMFRRLCGLRGQESPSFQREKLLERVGQHMAASTAHQVAAFIGEMCGIPFSSDESEMLRAARGDPRSMAKQISNALIEFLRAECSHSPVLLILEDLHWSDSLTVRCIEDAVTALSDKPLMVLALARFEVFELFPKLWKRLTVREIKLLKLSRKAAERLIHQVLGREVLASTVAQIVEQADGNALLLEELIRATAELGASAEAGTVLAILQSRLGRTEAGARRALRVASVLGTSFWAQAIESLLGGSPHCTTGQVEGWLTTLQNEELIEKQNSTRFPDQSEYRFRHALIREAAYELLTEEDRRRGHELAARYLIAREPGCTEYLELDAQSVLGTLLQDPGGRRALEGHGALFDIVHHLNQSRVLYRSSEARPEYADVNLMAALRAESANAIETALRYTEVGLTMLGTAGWETSFEMYFQLTTKQAELAYLSGAAERAEEIFAELEGHLTTLDHLTQYCVLRTALVELLGIPFTTPMDSLLERLSESERKTEG